MCVGGCLNTLVRLWVRVAVGVDVGDTNTHTHTHRRIVYSSWMVASCTKDSCACTHLNNSVLPPQPVFECEGVFVLVCVCLCVYYVCICVYVYIGF